MYKRDRDEPGVQYRKLFIGGLDKSTDDTKLKEHFEKWGEIVDVVVIKNPDTKQSKGYGFITYKEESSVDAAQSERPHTIEGKEVDCKRAIPRDQSGSPEANITSKKLFVGSISDETTEDELKEYFAQFGNVTGVNLVTEKDSDKRRGFGFVEFDDYDPVDKVVLRKDQHKLKGKKLILKKAMSKQERAEAEQKAYAKGGYGGYGGGGPGYGGGGYGGGYGGYENGYGNPWNQDSYAGGWGDPGYGGYGYPSGGPMRGGGGGGGMNRMGPYSAGGMRGGGMRGGGRGRW